MNHIDFLDEEICVIERLRFVRKKLRNFQFTLAEVTENFEELYENCSAEMKKLKIPKWKINH